MFVKYTQQHVYNKELLLPRWFFILINITSTNNPLNAAHGIWVCGVVKKEKAT